ncbi:peroxide stress protein YaaA [Portibacter lacus]|nr:peroxide stress protein YaaA [Portibacter lacus]
MITLISPAKTLDYSEDGKFGHTEARLLEHSMKLVDTLKKKSSGKLQKMMGISKNIADLNVERFQEFSPEFNSENSKPAILAFKGDVYLGLEADQFTQEEMDFAQDHLRILSGLYGLLRPLDLMQPYRLEMGTSLKTTRGKNLYQFWKNRITDLLNEDLSNHEHKTIVNLASNEYFKAINLKKLDGDLLTINFKEERDGEIKFISFNAKKARGMMSKFIVNNSIDNPNDLKGFDIDGYYLSEDHSTKDNWLFIR